MFSSRGNCKRTKTDIIAYSSERSNKRGKIGRREEGMDEERNMFFPVFAFPPPLFVSLSLHSVFSFLRFVNESIKHVV